MQSDIARLGLFPIIDFYSEPYYLCEVNSKPILHT